MAKKSTTNKSSANSSSTNSSSKKRKRSKAPAKRRDSDVNDKVYVATSPIHGKGMFACKKIKADVSLGRLEGMPTRDDGIYVLWITDELGLEVTNDFRFINHDSNPNCALTETEVVTLRAIKPDEELFHDYGW